MLGFLNKFIDANEKEIKKLSVIVESVNSLEKKYQKLTDSELSKKFSEFKEAHSKGKSLDQLLPEAFAAVREASVRTTGMRHFDVQLVAAAALHQGQIAEQKTGEGKTLSATPALFLNAIEGKGVHLITVNDYLSMLHAGWMGEVYHALGATTAVIVHEAAFIFDPKFKNNEHTDPRMRHLKPVSRQEAYRADITYGTNNEFGFDYLRDNMVRTLSQMVQRGHNFAVVDEVDSILIDEARTPLIISAPSGEPTGKYYEFAKIVDKLSADSDYVIDEKQRSASLTEVGITKIEKILGVENLYEKDFSTLHHIEQSLKAKTLFTLDRDYVVKDSEVVIVDEFTGRLMPGRRYSEGLHQAIEAKENVTIQQESQTLATVSFQNYFRMYQKLAGMTGTAATEAEEFHKIYKLDAVMVPTHQKMIRDDHPDVIYKTVQAKYQAVAEEVERIHKTGQPILVGTTSIEKNEFLSSLLKKKGISHALLNAKNHEKEAEIIAQAGKLNGVTVATNMAGRGVDIILGGNPPIKKEAEKVRELGGLYVIGTERHESRRIDNQLRGRAGRQGDQGTTKFFVSLEDDLMRIFGGDQVAKVMGFLKIPEDTPIEHGMVSKALESAQKKVEGHNFDVRKATVEYDDVMNQQRQIIYGIRKKILETAETVKGKLGTGLKQDVLEKIESEVKTIVELYTSDGLDAAKIVSEFSVIINFDDNTKSEIEKKITELGSTEGITELLNNIAIDVYQAREKEYGLEIVREMEVFSYLNILDTLWIEHLDTIDDLRIGIGLRAFGQREPLVEYKKESFILFEKLIKTIDHNLVHQIYKISISGAIDQSPKPIMVQEKHDEALDQDLLLEEVGSLISPLDKLEIKEQPVNQVTAHTGDTKVTIERSGGVVSSQTIRADGATIKQKIGRNDPCWCGSGKKYKKCHYPN